MRTWTALLLVLPALAGCLADDTDDSPDRDGIQRTQTLIGQPIELEHDHNDLSLHTESHNLEQLSWSSLDIELGKNGFANFVLWEGDGERLALVAIDGDHDGGFVIVDVSDPMAPEVLGSYMVPGNSFQEVRITPDGRFAVLNVQDLPVSAFDPQGSADATSTRAEDGTEYCGVCIHIINIEDRTEPTFVGYQPVELLGTHNMDFQVQDDVLYLYYVGQPLSYTPGSPASAPGNHVWIARFEETAPGSAALTPINSFQHVNAEDDGERSFPHDAIVDVHPVTGQTIAYLSHWDGGAITFDVSDPMQPVELDQEAEFAPSDALAIHWFSQEPEARDDGRAYAWSAPEIGALGSGTGVIRGYDITDPADISQVSTWSLPGDDLFIESAFILSPHTVIVDPETHLAAVSHYHAGVWILDVSDPLDPEHVAMYQPHGDEAAPYDGPAWWKKPNFDPDGYSPNTYMARWDDRGDETILWITDRSTGLYALRYTGDDPLS